MSDDGPAEDAGPSPIAFRLEPGSGVPTYLQLVQQVEQALRLGYLEPGDQLPGVKDVVGSLAINPNTVLKAYRELEHRGLAGGRRVNAVETAGLSKRYRRTWALRDCSLAVPAGHVVALVGPNGTGKTTLLNLAVGLTAPTGVPVVIAKNNEHR